MPTTPRSLDRPRPHDFVPLKASVLEILMALAETPLHGYGILQRVRERSEGRVELETGPLYRRMKRLLDDGLVAETDEPDHVEDGDERRRYYTLTDLGRRVLALEADRLAGLVARQRALGLIHG
ncbi:MAG: helix-turn-helix transcriptional regulator [Longimicrobiales bacterium]